MCDLCQLGSNPFRCLVHCFSLFKLCMYSMFMLEMAFNHVHLTTNYSFGSSATLVKTSSKLVSIDADPPKSTKFVSYYFP